ncbi:Sodium/hydrogen exchanger family-domain-containing protein [Kockiozyma suomiensis]|uniref:Sodium/hydrogen exchanger family-domain-containing protein n=1 Tax=Kockiozyma suomiensis TaxID=1337062 RepID=UPI0033430B5B
MAWDQLWIDKPHLAYAIIGGFTTIFSLISLFVKEKLYIGEATVATITGVIFGPYAANLFDPATWGNVDFITLEITRVVLIVQIFAVAVELPKKYMLRHAMSVFMLLVPVMTFGWLIASVFIWKLVPTLRWVEALCIAACITATDPVLASAVVGKGKFSKRVPGHLRNILSAESGCNDGMAFPFVYLALYLIRYEGQAGKIIEHWITLTVLYECVFGCLLGALIGYSGRHAIKFAEKHNLIDRESFLVFYFVLALFCTGVGSILGTDDLLVAFSAGAAFAWDGWFTHKTEESHVSNVIDLLLNLAYFVYFGSIVPWHLYNSPELGLSPWKLSIIAILIILFRRIPIMLAMKPFIPDIRTWREALFCGHFGPIGVGAVFIAILARAELEHDDPTPMAELPGEGSENYMIVATIWPIVSFMIIASIIVHGSSIAVFTLGKRLNTMAITMSVTTGNQSGPSWLQRLPRIDTSTSVSFRKVETTQNDAINRLFHRNAAGLATTEGEELRRPPAKAVGRMAHPKKSKSRKAQRKRKEKTTEISAADFPAGAEIPDELLQNNLEEDIEERINPAKHNVYQEGDNFIVEDENGEVLTTINSSSGKPSAWNEPLVPIDSEDSFASRQRKLLLRQRRHQQKEDGDVEAAHNEHRTQAIAYQLDDEIIVENEEGEVIRRYHINRHHTGASRPGESSLDRALSWVGLRRGPVASQASSSETTSGAAGIHTLEDLEMQRIDSSSARGAASSSGSTVGGSAGTNSAGGIEKEDLPRNFLQRRADEDLLPVHPPKSARHVDEDDEETPAERKRRLAALRRTSEDEEDEETPAERKRRLAALGEAANEDEEEEEEEDDSNGEYDDGDYDDEEDDDDDDEEEEDDDDEDDEDYTSDGGASTSRSRSSQEAPSRISFADETDIERRRRLAALGLAPPQANTSVSSSSSSSATATNENNADAISQGGNARGITWGAVKRSK